jgi:hypothetical protein
MFLHAVKFATTPESNLAINNPKANPETTMEREAARRCIGTRSPTRGSMSCGVTVLHDASAPENMDRDS